MPPKEICLACHPSDDCVILKCEHDERTSQERVCVEMPATKDMRDLLERAIATLSTKGVGFSREHGFGKIVIRFSIKEEKHRQVHRPLLDIIRTVFVRLISEIRQYHQLRVATATT